MSRAQLSEMSPHWRIAAIGSLAIVAAFALRNLFEPAGMDFIAFWAAAKLTIGGAPEAAYDVVVHRRLEEQAAIFFGQMPFAYPPPFLLLVAPLGLLPYPLAALVWIAASVAALALAVRRWLPGRTALALAFPPVFICGMIGQNGLFFAASIIAALALIGTRPLLAGLLLGCFVMKPQLALLVPIALLAGREWRAMAGAACGVIGLIALSLAVFGWPAWQGFLEMSQSFGAVAAQGQTGWNRLASVYAALRIFDLPEAAAALAHLSIAAVAAVAVWRVWRDPALAEARGAVLVSATLLASPYLYMHDQVMLVVAIGWIAAQGVRQTRLAALYALSLMCVGQMAVPELAINLLPVVPLALLAAIIHRTGIFRLGRARLPNRTYPNDVVTRPLPVKARPEG